MYPAIVNVNLIAVCAKDKDGIKINVDASVIDKDVEEVLYGTIVFVAAETKGLTQRFIIIV